MNLIYLYSAICGATKALDNGQSGGREQKCFQTFPEESELQSRMYDGRLFQITGAE